LAGKSAPTFRQAVSVQQRILRVLVVEDNQINQRVAQLQLEKLGCQVALCDCGETALRESLEDYDLIFMDCQMPGMDGLDTTREIRNSEKRQLLLEKSYIIAMTANALDDDRAACIAAGMDDFISKPVQISKLRSVINKALGEMDFGVSGVTSSPLPRETLKEILPMYLAQAHEQVVAIENAAKSGDTEGVLRVAHQLKGSSANLGVSALVGLCVQIENVAANGTDGLDSMVTDLGRQLELAKTQLRRAAR
jgi:CheY-like chemotaxis protein